MTAAELIRTLEPHEVPHVADADQIQAAHSIIAACKRERDRQRELLERIPKINTESVAEDIRFKLGLINALSAVIDIPRAAKELAKAKE